MVDNHLDLDSKRSSSARLDDGCPNTSIEARKANQPIIIIS